MTAERQLFSSKSASDTALAGQASMHFLQPMQALILLSGGLDSFVALDIISKKYDKILALFFNYSQKAYKEERLAVEKITEKYKIEFKEINLPFLSEITHNSWVAEDKNDFDKLESVWIPNRNGLFLNIASSH